MFIKVYTLIINLRCALIARTGLPPNGAQHNDDWVQHTVAHNLPALTSEPMIRSHLNGLVLSLIPNFDPILRWDMTEPACFIFWESL